MSQDLLGVQRREDLIPVVAQLIQGLPKREQLVLSLSVVEELTLPEIGTVLDLPEDRVLQLYNGAMRHLRTQLSAWRAREQSQRQPRGTRSPQPCPTRSAALMRHTASPLV
jgi:DNA-directed RNA polymerase specialized sigma24 family protein